MKNSVAAILLGVGMAACGGDFSGPTAAPKPTPLPTYVQVAGNYVGTVAVVFPQVGISRTCAASTTVNQANDVVYFLPIVEGPPCNDTFTLGTVVIDPNGRVPSFPETNAVQIGNCQYIEVLDGGFAGNQFRLSVALTVTPPSTACPTITENIVLTRQ
jgi:hypothetical protein